MLETTGHHRADPGQKCRACLLVGSALHPPRHCNHRALVPPKPRISGAANQAAKSEEEAVAKELAAKENLKPADIAHLLELSDTVEESVGDVDRILERKLTELEHNRSLEKGIGFQLQMDALRKSATVLRNESLMMLENYRTGLGYQVAEVADKIIDAEYAKLEAIPEKIPAPPLAPSNEESNELGTQDASEPNQQPQK